MEVITEGRKSKWDIDSVKKHIEKFNTLNDFYDDPNSKDITTWVGNRRTRTGDQSLTMQNLLSELKEKDEKQITENLKIKLRLPDDFNESKYDLIYDKYKDLEI